MHLMPPKPETHNRFFCEIQPVLGPSADQICLTQSLPGTKMSWAWIFQDLQLQELSSVTFLPFYGSAIILNSAEYKELPVDS